MTSWESYNGASIAVESNIYNDLLIGKITYGSGDVNGVYWETAYPTNYIGYTLVTWTSTHMYGSPAFYLLSDSKAYICGKYNNSWTNRARIEIKREGTSINYYVNGQYTETNGGQPTIPAYYVIGQYHTDACKVYIDDVVIGTNEEHNVISCPPQTWFVAKDIVDPGFSGLYSAPNTQVYASAMHSSYATDDGSATVTVTGPGGVVDTETVSSYAGIITWNLTEMLFTSGAPYGQYTVSIDGSSASDTFTYKAVATSGTSIAWDNTTYLEDQLATMTYSVAESYWLTDDYTYKITIEDQDFEELWSLAVVSRPVADTDGVWVTQELFPLSAYYYCCLYAVDKSSLEEILLDADYAYMDVDWLGGGVTVNGTTYDVTTGNDVGSVSVTITQDGTDHTTSSGATDAQYQISDLEIGESIGVNATKDGYVCGATYFTPYVDATYTVDIGLWPATGAQPGAWYDVTGGQFTVVGGSNVTTQYYNLTEDGTAIGGVVYLAPYWEFGGDVNCTLSNATWSDSNLTTDTGWYQMNNIPAAGEYTLSCSKTGWATASQAITITEANFNRVDAYLNANFTLTVYVRDLVSNALITTADPVITLDTGESATCTNGVCTFTGLDYGYYTCSGTCLDYYPSSSSTVVDESKEATVYLQSVLDNPSGETQGYGVSYAPKSVRFTVQTIWGKPIEDCAVTCTGYENTVGSWEWVYELFGVNATETPIATTSMTGLTDYKGDINFLMFEPVKYDCSFVKAGEINKNVTIYPKDEYYLIMATEFGNTSWYEGGVDINAAVNVTVSTAVINSTANSILVTYSDSSGGTTGGTIYLNQTDPDDKLGPEITVDTYTITGNSCSNTFTCTNCAGESYIIRVKPTHSTWDFERDFTVSFPEEQFNPMGLTDTELMLIAVFIILFTGCFFGAVSAPHAPLIMCFLGWIFLVFGWLDAIILTAAVSLTLATVLSVLYLIMVRSKKERWV
ncbi:MAG: hypothetical protein PHS30_04020 [Bacteroidales bacterium]|nr:hypothetical protein [Bacteroidales bacterium]